jgi:hypothetical protein
MFCSHDNDCNFCFLRYNTCDTNYNNRGSDAKTKLPDNNISSIASTSLKPSEEGNDKKIFRCGRARILSGQSGGVQTNADSSSARKQMIYNEEDLITEKILRRNTKMLHGQSGRSYTSSDSAYSSSEELEEERDCRCSLF